MGWLLSTISTREQGWCSGERARLPPMCPGFDSRNRCHMSVEFVAVSLPAPRGFSSGTPVFHSPHKRTFFNSNSIWIIVKHFIIEARVIAKALTVFDIKFTLTSFYIFFLHFTVPVVKKSQNILKNVEELQTVLFEIEAAFNPDL